MHFTSQEIGIMVSAFAIGLVAGGYLYITGYVPQFAQNTEAPAAEEMTEFTIEGDIYGGMRAGIPPSFQILADGTYRYLPFADITATTGAKVSQGLLPKATMKELRALLTPTDLTLAAKETEKASCASMVDGIDYRFNISVSGAEFVLDTCKTTFSPDSAIGKALIALFDTLKSEVKLAE